MESGFERVKQFIERIGRDLDRFYQDLEKFKKERGVPVGNLLVDLSCILTMAVILKRKMKKELGEDDQFVFANTVRRINKEIDDEVGVLKNISYILVEVSRESREKS